MRDYNHKKVEAEMQEAWEKEDLYQAPQNPGKDKRYILDMFPYPSGSGLHVGHVEGYTATDIYSRYSRMRGFDVLHPMGWDAFGLPAENYAVKTGVHPQETTDNATDNFRRQIKSLGLSYDWSRELNTSRPDYYTWTQWLFLLFYKHGLAYKKKAAVNWCPGCQTVLANEQVIDGECERCGSVVEKKDMEQWFFNITKYAEELITGLDSLDWPESTKLAQKHWIGKSEGAEIDFPLDIKTRFVILHGYAGGPDKNFVPWLERELLGRGYSVEVPELPNPEKPDVSEQIEYVKKNVTFDENTIVIAHSLGSVVAMKVLESAGVRIQRLVLAGGFLDTDIKTDRGYFDTFDWTFDFEKIRDNVGNTILIRDTHDDAIPAEQADKLKRALGGDIVDVKAAKPHFRAKEEPVVLKAALPKLSVFTTRPDTIYGATYMVVAPEHGLIESNAHAIRNITEVRAYVKEAKDKTDIERSAEGKEKTGVLIEGVQAINPATNGTIPIFVADYVLPGYGTGAIMAVPAHDERDFEFAKEFGLPIVEVVAGEEELPRAAQGELINSGEFDGLSSEDAKRKITESVGGEMKTTYRLRDWLVSRQRYWGAPIPVVYDPDGNPHPVPEQYLPWTLPTDVDYQPKGTAPLGSSKELKERTEKLFGKGWTPEIDTMDTFVDSSWYFFRFADPHNESEFADKREIQKWLSVDTYVGGAEHTVLHLLYARFFTKVLRDLGLVDIDEPFAMLRHQGMILGPDGNKMSKSKGNIINPDEMIERFGADTLRMYEMFMGPIDQAKAWSTDNMVGVRRFIEKVWRTWEKVNDDSEDTGALVAKTTKKVGEDIADFKFNTAISSLMILANEFEKKDSVSRGDFETLLLLLAPFAPHITDCIWREMNHKQSIHSESWPTYNEADIKEDTVTIVVQVDGKVRANITVASDASKVDIEAAAHKDENAAKRLEGAEVERVIVVPGRLINFVTKK